MVAGLKQTLLTSFATSRPLECVDVGVACRYLLGPRSIRTFGEFFPVEVVHVMGFRWTEQRPHCTFANSAA